AGLSDRYTPQEVEGRIYQFWESRGHFNAEDRSTKPPYAIILPPPNVTGFLHMGHALDHTIQDTLIRWKRMSGFNALWLPGTDHAGIATQNVVEKELKKEGKTRKDLGREKFLDRVWEWKKTYGDRIVNQMKRLGDSCDWRRLTFTLDENVSQAVRRVFVQLYRQDLIYRGTRLVNWCPRCETAVSDLEVEHIETKGHLWHIAYPVEGTSEKLVVATTRPETMLGDTAVAVHPDDERYSALIGKNVVLPLLNRKIPIIGDTYVDREFGSGVVKITPAHDFNDYQIGDRHKLKFINILTVSGQLNDEAGPYKGLSVKDARAKVLEDLKAQNLLVKEEDHRHAVGHCERCNTVIEPFLSKQWFVKIKDLANPAQRVAESGTIVFEPESWTKTYLHWMSNITDWCISRQLWWGHRIPAWHCQKCQTVNVAETKPENCEKCKSSELVQDDDVLDTWFSSGLWPFSTMGWPQETETQKTFYPTNVLVTGHDIIFFWVARMIMLGLHFKKDVPFRTVYLHGIVRDAQGRKMSKSLGNALDPVELIDKHGADALRFTILCQIASGRDMKFSEQRLEGYRNFMNKIWNATRFSLAALEDFKTPEQGTETLPKKSELSQVDRWITYRLGQVERSVEEFLEQYRFSDAANTLYDFVWHDFCDWYLEFVKPVIYGQPSTEREATQLVLAQTLNRIVRLLHPMVPFITEEIYAKLPIRNEAAIVDQYPTVLRDRTWLSIGSEEAAHEIELVKEVIAAIRNIRGENGIKPSQGIKVFLDPSDGDVQKLLGKNKTSIMRMAKVDECVIDRVESLSKCAVTPVVRKDSRVQVIVPLEGLVDIEEEIKRLGKAIEKNQKDINLMTQRLSNENFVKNAPEDIVAKDKEVLEALKQKNNNMRENLARLQS
ncbi:MAG TPA: valine--tRNA ligase, partial [Bdellovibrionales bacterium]|nr:valine--tRNA ligase [Bdellovibrionales bacterium]